MVAAQSSTGASQTELDDAVEDIKAAADELTGHRRDRRPDLRAAPPGRRPARPEPLDPRRQHRDAEPRHLDRPAAPAAVRCHQADHHHHQRAEHPRAPPRAPRPDARWSLLPRDAAGPRRRRRPQPQRLAGAVLRARRRERRHRPSRRRHRRRRGRRPRRCAPTTAPATRAVRTGTSTVLGGSDAYDEYDKLAESLLPAGRPGPRRHGDQRPRARPLRRRHHPLRPARRHRAWPSSSPARCSARSVGSARAPSRSPTRTCPTRSPGSAPARSRPSSCRSTSTTQEEIGQLARAVDDLHRRPSPWPPVRPSCVRQVGEMFVTLSRRNTTLINQQLNLIETLEKDEEDPKRLESLFRLDHLASRMRRTADSLLILADAPTRSAGWESLTVTEATQAATAGCAGLPARARRARPSTAGSSEAAAGDLIHLLTELVDNALSYSSPSTNVTLSTAPAPGGLTIDVSDSGLGIPEESLRQINETLESGADVTPDTARRMGLFVVSRLAQAPRHRRRPRHQPGVRHHRHRVRARVGHCATAPRPCRRHPPRSSPSSRRHRDRAGTLRARGRDRRAPEPSEQLTSPPTTTARRARRDGHRHRPPDAPARLVDGRPRGRHRLPVR